MVEMAVENSTPSEMTLLRLVLSSVAPESAVETTTPADVVLDSADEAIADRDVCVDLQALDDVDSAVFSERLLET
jgi:hypothetical protein